MAILDLGLSEGPYTESGIGVRVYERDDGSGARDIRLVWSTEYDSDTQKSFYICVKYSGRRKGKTPTTIWRRWYETVDASKCHETQPYPGGRTWWSHDFAIGMQAQGGLLLNMAGREGWRYDTREFDGIEMEVEIYANWHTDVLGDGVARSESAFAQLWINYVPDYHVTSVYYDEGDIVVIEYETTWTRQDDRWWIEHDSYIVDGGELLRSDATGTIVAPGRIEFPTSCLTRHIKGEQIYLDLKFNAAYRPIGMTFSWAKGVYKVEDRAICNTPTLTVIQTDDPYSISIKTGDSGDVGKPIVNVTVKLRAERGPSEEVTVPVGAVAKMRCCPLNMPLVFDGVGSNGKATSKKATIAVSAIKAPDIVVIDSVDNQKSRAIVQYNKTYAVSAEAEYETVRLAGRDRPSTFYGAGGTTSIEVSGDLIDETGISLERMPELGDCFIRFPDGRAYRIAMKVSLSWEHSRIRNVSISGEEVGAS